MGTTSELHSGSLGYKGICDYCERAVFVLSDERWCSKGEKVWHLECSHAAPPSMTRTMSEATKTEMQNLLGQGYGAIQQQLGEVLAQLKAGSNIAIAPEHRSVECDHRSPLVQAIERGFREWEKGECHEPGCGCVTVYIHKEIAAVPVLRLDDAVDLTRRSAAIEEKIDDIIERLDGVDMRLNALTQGLIRLHAQHPDPAVAIPEAPRRFGRRPAKKNRGKNGR